MPKINVEKLEFQDKNGKPLDWLKSAVGLEGFYGYDADDLYLVAVASGQSFKDMPDKLPVILESRVPNKLGGARSLGPKTFSMEKKSTDGSSTTYRLVQSWDSLPFGADSRPEAATVVRSGKDAFSDRSFRNKLNYTNRGVARQRIDKTEDKNVKEGKPPGSAENEEPSAEMVMLCGGVEVLEAKIPPDEDRKVTEPAKALVRSPANVLFYSGHGLEFNGALAVEIEGSPGEYSSWMFPQFFYTAWISGKNKNRTRDMEILVLNGCNVLNLQFYNGAPGKMYARLHIKNGGSLTHILGYAGKAPKDKDGGGLIAEKTGEAINAKKGITKTWMEENAKIKRWGAVAIDDQGYHKFLERRQVIMPWGTTWTPD